MPRKSLVPPFSPMRFVRPVEFANHLALRLSSRSTRAAGGAVGGPRPSLLPVRGPPELAPTSLITLSSRRALQVSLKARIPSAFSFAGTGDSRGLAGWWHNRPGADRHHPHRARCRGVGEPGELVANSPSGYDRLSTSPYAVQVSSRTFLGLRGRPSHLRSAGGVGGREPTAEKGFVHSGIIAPRPATTLSTVDLETPATSFCAWRSSARACRPSMPLQWFSRLRRHPR